MVGDDGTVGGVVGGGVVGGGVVGGGVTGTDGVLAIDVGLVGESPHPHMARTRPPSTTASDRRE